MEFIKAGIEGREYAKFVFTRSLSDALSLIREFGEDYGLSAEDCAFIDYDVIRTLYSESGSVRDRCKRASHGARSSHALTRQLVLPPLIASPDDVFAFHLPPTQPNFITRKSITARLLRSMIRRRASRVGFCSYRVPIRDLTGSLRATLVGFVTQFGGANSHMAIRASELEFRR